MPLSLIKKASAFLVYISVFTISLISYNTAYANVDTLLLSPFKLTIQDADEVEANFNTALYLRLEEQGFNVIISDSQIQNISNAQTLAKVQGTYATLYGSVTQVGKSFLVDAQYVTASGQNTPIIFEIASNFPADGVAARLTLATLQASNLPALQNERISEIRVQGNSIIDAEYIIARLQTTTNSPLLTEEELNDELKRIWRTGYFNDISITTLKENNNNIMLIEVVERPTIANILLEGSDIIDIDDIREDIVTATGSILNESVLKNDLGIIEELYRKKAYYNVQVAYTIEELSNNSINLIFDVDAGNKLYITNIDFQGFGDMDVDFISDNIPVREHSFFSFITGRGALKEEELEIATEYIGSYAINDGYIRSTVAAPEVIFEEEGIRIIFKIDRGARFKVGEVNFAGELIADPDVFYNIIGMDEWKNENGYFSLITMQDDIQALTQYYKDNGYAFASANMQDTVNIEAETMDITYVLNPSSKTQINRVNVAGNYKTRDNVILRELRLADGDPYSAQLVQRSQDRLYRTGYFKIVDMQLEPTEDPVLADLNITVEENSTGTISGGIGYSSDDGAGISASISQNNLFGRGYSLGVEGYLAQEEMNMNTHFFNPRIYDTNLGFGIALYGITEEWTEFDRDTLGGQVNFVYPIGEFTSARLGYRLDDYTIYNVDAVAAQSIKDYEGDNLASVASLTLSRNTTNANFFPTRGTKTTASLNYGGNFLGGTDNFIGTTYEIGGYYSPFENHVLHARATFAGVFQNTNDVIPAFERIYIGGMTTLRGYDSDDISPRDALTNETIGADRAIYATLEYAWIFEENLGLAVVPFLDYATVVDSDYKELFDNEFFSVGLELRWSSPMGDLRFAYGYPLSKSYYGEELKSGRFEFSMGQAF